MAIGKTPVTATGKNSGIYQGQNSRGELEPDYFSLPDNTRLDVVERYMEAHLWK